MVAFLEENVTESQLLVPNGAVTSYCIGPCVDGQTPH